MTKVQLHKGSPIYTEYEFSQTELRIQDLLNDMGLRLPPPLLIYKPQRITDACPVNFGYETGGAKKGTSTLAVHYGRWTNIVGRTQLERALQDLAQEKYAYQCLKFSCAHAGARYFHVQVLPYCPASFLFTRDFPHGAEIRQYVVEQYPDGCEAVEMDGSYRYKEFYHCRITFIEICEAVIGALRVHWDDGMIDEKFEREEIGRGHIRPDDDTSDLDFR
jgi:hypothetical protein